MPNPASPVVPTSSSATQDPAAQHQPRIEFVALHVTDEAKSLAFYVDLLGMQQGARRQRAGQDEIPVSFPQPGGTSVLLLPRANKTALQHGTAYSRFGLAVGDITGLVERLRAAGVTIMTQPTRTESLKLSYAMVRDPDGYLIEMLQFDAPSDASAATQPPVPRISFLSFNLTDTDKALAFYSRVLGLEKRGSFDVGNGTTEIFVGFAETLPGEATLVLLSNKNRTGALSHGDDFDRFAIRVPDLGVFTARLSGENVQLAEPALRDEAGKLSRASFDDLDGYRVELRQYD